MGKQATDDQSRPVELSEQQLDNVAGGTKKVDASSPKLFAQCANGKHFATGVITVR